MTTDVITPKTPVHGKHQAFCDSALRVIETEKEAIVELKNRINGGFSQACQLLLDCQGRIVVAGMGKSGHIARKIAATLASTGCPAFFVHPAEASHGDLGMITAKDVVILLSYSGETTEILTILPLIKRLGCPLISLTGNMHSTVAKASNIHLDVGVAKEACPMDLTPTASTTAALVMGDAVAIALLEAKGFTSQDFAFSHPGGKLGRKLLLRIADVMKTGKEIPHVLPRVMLREALLEISQKRLGMTAVVDEQNHPIGIFTDGDLRRALEKDCDIYQIPVSSLMTKHCKTIHEEALAAEALQLMETHKISSLLVVDKAGCLVGALNIHDLLKAGVV